MIKFIEDDFSELKRYELIYVASPFTKYIWGMDAAWNDIAKVTGRLVLHGLSVYSPIVHTYKIAIAAGINPIDSTENPFWLKFDNAFMRKSDALLIAQLPGWEDSFGVAYEIDAFTEANKPMYAFNPGIVR